MDKFKKIFIILSFCLLPCSWANNSAQQETYKHDYLYSQEYFDYLIECASIEKQNEDEEIKAQKKTQ